MPALILELSKYIFLLLMVIYIGLTFLALRKKDNDFRKAIYYFCEIITLIFYALGMANLVLKQLDNGDHDAVRSLGILAGMEFALLIFLPLIMRIIYRDVNNLLLCQMEMLMAIGFIMLARLNFKHAQRQFIIIAVSCVIFLIIPVIVRKLDLLRNLTWVYGGVGAAGLAVVLIAGNVVNGNVGRRAAGHDVHGLLIPKTQFVHFLRFRLESVEIANIHSRIFADKRYFCAGFPYDMPITGSPGNICRLGSAFDVEITAIVYCCRRNCTAIIDE